MSSGPTKYQLARWHQYQLAKRLLVAAGRRTPDSVLNYLTLGSYLRGQTPALFRERVALWQHIAGRLARERVLYLEFGVAAGNGLRHWSRLLEHPESQLHGFDSFEGLPTDWIKSAPAGKFTQGGQPPVIDDHRVRLHSGLFCDTLPGFAWPEGLDHLVVNFDADLYDSTREALDLVEPHVQPGTLFYFDEFNHRDDELRAFDEYLRRTGHEAVAVAATRDLAHIVFRIG